MVHIIKQNQIANLNKNLVKTKEDIKFMTALIGSNHLGFKCEISYPEDPSKNTFRIVLNDDGYHFKGIPLADGKNAKEKDYYVEAPDGENSRLLKKMAKHPELIEYVLVSYDPEFNEEKTYEPYIIYNAGMPMVYDLMFYTFFDKLKIKTDEELQSAARISLRAGKILGEA